jgi:hypothetical protein
VISENSELPPVSTVGLRHWRRDPVRGQRDIGLVGCLISTVELLHAVDRLDEVVEFEADLGIVLVSTVGL